MSYKSSVLALCFITLLSGCSTTHQSCKKTGHGHQPVSKDYFAKETLANCAKITIHDGYKYFVIVGGEVDPPYRSYTTPSTYNQYMNTGLAICGRSPTVLIKMYHGRQRWHSSRTYEARELLGVTTPPVLTNAW